MKIIGNTIKEPSRTLDEIVFGNLIEKCWKCNWLKQGKCNGIEREKVQKEIVIVKTTFFTVVTTTECTPLCPKLFFGG